MGRLQAVIVEVHNTHGERHLYTLRSRRAPSDDAFSASMDKDFYVSPFIGSDGRYHVTVRDEPDRLRIGIDLRQEGELVLATSLVLARRPLTHARPPVDAGAAPAHHAQDDRDDPPGTRFACFAAVSSFIAIGRTDDSPRRWRYDPARRHFH